MLCFLCAILYCGTAGAEEVRFSTFGKVVFFVLVLASTQSAFVVARRSPGVPLAPRGLLLRRPRDLLQFDASGEVRGGPTASLSLARVSRASFAGGGDEHSLFSSAKDKHISKMEKSAQNPFYNGVYFEFPAVWEGGPEIRS